MKSISIVGLGRVGGALALALAEGGCKIVSVSSTAADDAAGLVGHLSPRPEILSPEQTSQIGGEIVLLTVRDDQIPGAAKEIANSLAVSGRTILHTSGSRTSDLLDPLRRLGANVGSMHPLVSISEPHLGVERFEGAYFCLEGDTPAVRIAEGLVATLGGSSFTVPADKKPLYHAAAVMSCGHLVALIDAAIEMLASCGPEPDEAKKILLPLISSTVENLRTQSPGEALTGTFARADIETLERHIASFKASATREALEIYLLLGERSLRLALERGADPELAAEMRRRMAVS